MTTSTHSMPQSKRPGGRPAKFDEPSRPVTVTLPERILRELDTIGPDRGNAIVRLVEAALPNAAFRPHVELAKTGSDTGLIVVGPCPGLEKIPFLHLVEIAPARYVLALDPGKDFHSLELAVRDVLEETDASNPGEQSLLTDLLELIQKFRKSARMRMAEILFVRLVVTTVLAV